MAGLPADAALLTKSSGRVKAARRLARRASRAELGLFLAEGPQAVREALTLENCVREVFAVPGAAAQNPEIHEASAGLPWHLVDEAALASLAETVHPQGLVAVCRAVDRPLDDLLDARPRLLAVCADVRDPGNAGTVIRCADAAGADGVVGEVRGDLVTHLPLAVGGDPRDVVRRLREAGLTVLAADGAGETDLDEAEERGLLDRPTAWLFGNEAWGLPDDLAALADHRVAIPIHGRAESLNLATAAAVCLYSSARAHRRARNG